MATVKGPCAICNCVVDSNHPRFRTTGGGYIHTACSDKVLTAARSIPQGVPHGRAVVAMDGQLIILQDNHAHSIKGACKICKGTVFDNEARANTADGNYIHINCAKPH
jgi:hypothetical protein